MTLSPLLITLARQGDAAAITALMNAALRSQAVRVKTRLRGDCLQVMLRSPDELNPHAAIAFIRRGLLRLQAESIRSVRAYAWHRDPDFPIWIAEFEVFPVEQPLVQAVQSMTEPSRLPQEGSQSSHPAADRREPLIRDYPAGDLHSNRAMPAPTSTEGKQDTSVSLSSESNVAFPPAVTTAESLLPRSPSTTSKRKPARFSVGVLVIFAVVVYWMVAIV